MSLHAVGTVLEAPPAKHLNILFGGETNEEDFRGDDCSGVRVLDRGLRGRGGQGSGSGGGEGRPGGEEGIPGGRQCSPGGRGEGREDGPRFFRVAVRPHKLFPGPAGRGTQSPRLFCYRYRERSRTISCNAASIRARHVASSRRYTRSASSIVPIHRWG